MVEIWKGFPEEGVWSEILKGKGEIVRAVHLKGKHASESPGKLAKAQTGGPHFESSIFWNRI